MTSLTFPNYVSVMQHLIKHFGKFKTFKDKKANFQIADYVKQVHVNDLTYFSDQPSNFISFDSTNFSIL